MTLPETAARIAGYSNVKRAKVSAIAFSKSGQIIATSHNRRISGRKGKWTQHAEEVLLEKLHRLKAFDRFKDITILVTRINKAGATMAKPCANCQKLLDKHPVHVIYSDWDGNIQSV